MNSENLFIFKLKLDLKKGHSHPRHLGAPSDEFQSRWIRLQVCSPYLKSDESHYYAMLFITKICAKTSSAHIKLTLSSPDYC